MSPKVIEYILQPFLAVPLCIYDIESWWDFFLVYSLRNTFLVCVARLTEISQQTLWPPCRLPIGHCAVGYCQRVPITTIESRNGLFTLDRCIWQEKISPYKNTITKIGASVSFESRKICKCNLPFNPWKSWLLTFASSPNFDHYRFWFTKHLYSESSTNTVRTSCSFRHK